MSLLSKTERGETIYETSKPLTATQLYFLIFHARGNDKENYTLDLSLSIPKRKYNFYIFDIKSGNIRLGGSLLNSFYNIRGRGVKASSLAELVFYVFGFKTILPKTFPVCIRDTKEQLTINRSADQTGLV